MWIYLINRKAFLSDIPFPISDLRHIKTILSNILLVFNKLVLHELVEISACVSKLWKSFDNFHNKVETVYLILNSHVEWSCDRTLFVVASYIKVAVVTMIEKLVDKCRIAVECKYDRLVLCEQCVKVSVGKSVWVL